MSEAVTSPSIQPPIKLWRNVALLGVAQALANTLQTMGVATTPLVAAIMLGEDKSWATVPLVFTHVGLMLTAIPASLLMQRSAVAPGSRSAW